MVVGRFFSFKFYTTATCSFYDVIYVVFPQMSVSTVLRLKKRHTRFRHQGTP